MILCFIFLLEKKKSFVITIVAVSLLLLLLLSCLSAVKKKLKRGLFKKFSLGIWQGNCLKLRLIDEVCDLCNCVLFVFFAEKSRKNIILSLQINNIGLQVTDHHIYMTF